MSGDLDMQDFEERLDRLGPDLDTWPEADRAAAATLLARSERARSVLDAARLVERVLRAPVEPADERLRRAVLAIPLEVPRPARTPGLADRIAGLLAGGWRLATAGAGMALATGLLGFVLGMGQMVPLPGLAGAAAEVATAEAASPEMELAALLDEFYTLEDVP